MAVLPLEGHKRSYLWNHTNENKEARFHQ